MDFNDKFCEPCRLLGLSGVRAIFRSGTDFTPVCDWHIDHPWTVRPPSRQEAVDDVLQAARRVVAVMRSPAKSPALNALKDAVQALDQLQEPGSDAT